MAELAQLRRDEQLGRTAALNDGSGSAENAREDEALSRVLALPPEISEHDRYWVATASASPVSLC